MDLFDEFLKHPDVVKQPRGGDGEAQAWCPWHPDKAGGNPSLGINTKKKIVKCFVCEKGGAKALAEAWGITQESTYQRQEIEQTYDYRKPDGTIVFQVVRFKVPPGEPKKIVQRRPDPEDPNRWIWNLKEGVQTVLYRLPELRAADPADWVWIVEGEKDVDRLSSLGLVATTNPQGAGKWRSNYNKELRNRQVAVIPDNDNPGVDHAVFVAKSLQKQAVEVKIIHLPGLEGKGADVSDWLDLGHDVTELMDLLNQSLPFEPESEVETFDQGDKTLQPEWTVSRLLPDARKITALLKGHGIFVNAGDEAFFFDRETSKLSLIHQGDQALTVLLGERYSINRRDNFFSYLLEHLLLEAWTRGENALVRRFSYHDAKANTCYLDMGAGRVLKITQDTLEERANGDDDILFMPMLKHEPWEYTPHRLDNALYTEFIKGLNFSQEDGAMPVNEQRALFLAWLTSLAFESVMPTKIIASAVGPSGSGKSSMFRNAGRILVGPRFQLSSLGRAEKGEDSFWVKLKHSFFCCYDNIDETVKWLPDALAQVATGIERPGRVLYSDNDLVETAPSCMVALTSRTPRESLRREDVASRILLFTFKKLDQVTPEYDLNERIVAARSVLMSDYAALVQKTLAYPMEKVEVSDTAMRMADFARVATRIGYGLGSEMGELLDRAIAGLGSAQHSFAIEEDPVATVLEEWLNRTAPSHDDDMHMGPRASNEGRPLPMATLYRELLPIAKEYRLNLGLASHQALAAYMKNHQTAFAQRFVISRNRGGVKGRALTIHLVRDTEEGESRGV